MQETNRNRLALVAHVCLGATLFAAAPLTLHEPLGVALWSVVAAIVLLPLAFADQLRASRYAAACLAIVLGVLIFVGLIPAIVVAAVAWSLLGGVQFLVALRMLPALAIAATMLGAALSFMWPIWMAGVLSTHDLGPWLQRMINISPAFALNAAIAPDDPLTHRLLAYRLMNLGQDENYSMPTSVWPCVLLHAGVGMIGWMGRGWTRMNATQSSRDATPSPVAAAADNFSDRR